MTHFQRLIWKDSIDFKELQKQVSEELKTNNKSFEALKEKYQLDMPDLSYVYYFDDPSFPIYSIAALAQQKELDIFNQYLFEKIDKVLSILLRPPVSKT